MELFLKYLKKRNYVKAMNIIRTHDYCINSWKNKLGDPILHIVIKNQEPFFIVKLLIKYGADINATDVLNMTPLHICLTYYINETILKYLLNLETINVNIKNVFGYTPLCLALFYHVNPFIIEMLLKNCTINIYLRNDNNHNAIDLAKHSARTYSHYPTKYLILLYQHLLKELWFLETNLFQNKIQWLPQEIVNDLVNFLVR